MTECNLTIKQVKEKGFVLPKEFEFYGKMIDTKNPAKVHNDMAMIALLKSNFV